MPQILALFAGHGLKFAALFGMLAMIGTWDWKRMKAAENRGAIAEKKSVEDTGRKIHAKAKTARSLATKKSDDSLSKYYRD